MNLKTIYTKICTLLLLTILTQSAFAQCETWNSASNKDELENTHIFYKDAIKLNDYAKALPLWEDVFSKAPAADGKRASHYSDGRDIIKNIYASSDEAKQTELFDRFLKLYDQEYECYPKDKNGKDKKGYLLENKAYELYYTFNYDRDVIFEALQGAKEVSGKNLGYSVIYPFADIATMFFTEKKLTADETVEIYNYLNEVCDHQIKTNKQFSAYYQQQKDLANERFDVESDALFGCEYFTKKLRADYEANPNDRKNYTDIHSILWSKGCTAENSDLMAEIQPKIDKDKAADFAVKKADYEAKKSEWEANNPASMAVKAYKEGNYQEAVTKYQEAIDQETDATKKADYHYYLAVTYGRKLNEYSKAKKHAKESISLNPNSGKPYMLLGDLYAKSARSCGSNAFEQRMVILAAMDKWYKAKSVDSDPEVQADANKKISTYSGQYPDKEMLHMNGKKEGDYHNVGCWIGESVKVRAK